MPSSPAHILIAGGGVAALEALIALRELAGDRPRVTLLVDRHSLAAIAREFGARFVRDSLASVDPDARIVTTGSGESLSCDSLLSRSQ